MSVKTPFLYIANDTAHMSAMSASRCGTPSSFICSHVVRTLRGGGLAAGGCVVVAVAMVEHCATPRYCPRLTSKIDLDQFGGFMTF